jgi:hypothetical protein
MPYSNIQPPFTLEFREMAKEDVKAFGNWFLDIMPSRLAILAAAVQETRGFKKWKPDRTPASLGALGKWFAQQVETEPSTAEEIEEIRRNLVFPIDIPEDDLTIRTFSLAMDIGMYLGEVVVSNVPGAKWQQLRTGTKNDADYGYVLIVMPKALLPMNPVSLAVTLAYGVARGRRGADALAELYEIWTNRMK